MTCTWCNKDAVLHGRLPLGVRGKEQWAACDDHKDLIKRLKLVALTPDEVRLEMKRAKEQKAQ
jgi:hypothetical protein